jgi:UDP-N-acetyl-D-mannosaminuronic acid dehydrogenase
MYEDEELALLGLDPWQGEPIDAAIIQADHREYALLSPADLPGALVVYDGRGVLAASGWGDESGLVVIGQGDTTA